MKKNTIIFVWILVILVVLIGIYLLFSNNKRDSSLKETGNIKIVPTMQETLQGDTAWCGTFQLIWNDLKKEIVQKDIEFIPQIETVKHLNKEEFTSNMLSEKSYYKKHGIVSLDLKKEIQKAIKDKFNQTSDILNDFTWQAQSDKDYFLYAMLAKEFKFSTVFQEWDNSTFGDNQEDVQYFGIKTAEAETKKMRAQVNVLYYLSQTDYAVVLKTTTEDEILLCRGLTGNTFEDRYTQMLEKTSTFEGKKEFVDSDKLKVPNMKFRQKQEFTELERQEFLLANGETYQIEKALQTIEFELDKVGGRIKSEAGMQVNKASSAVKNDNRYFLFDQPFTLFLRETGKEKPYFAANVEDIAKFQ